MQGALVLGVQSERADAGRRRIQARSFTARDGGGELRQRVFGPVLAEYERITGHRETNINAFYHISSLCTDLHVPIAANPF